jgi:hypothetical protein
MDGLSQAIGAGAFGLNLFQELRSGDSQSGTPPLVSGFV